VGLVDGATLLGLILGWCAFTDVAALPAAGTRRAASLLSGLTATDVLVFVGGASSCLSMVRVTYATAHSRGTAASGGGGGCDGGGNSSGSLADCSPDLPCVPGAAAAAACIVGWASEAGSPSRLAAPPDIGGATTGSALTGTAFMVGLPSTSMSTIWAGRPTTKSAMVMAAMADGTRRLSARPRFPSCSPADTRWYGVP